MAISTRISNDEIERRLEAMPPEVFEAYESSDTGRIILEAGRNQGLPFDKIGKIADVLGYLMLGFLPAKDFTSELEAVIGDKAKAAVVAADINQKILLPIRDLLKQTYGGERREGARAQPSPAPQPQEPRIKAVPPPPVQILQSKTWAGQPPSLPKRPEPIIIKPLPQIGKLEIEKIETKKGETEKLEIEPSQISRNETQEGQPPLKAQPAPPPPAAKPSPLPPPVPKPSPPQPPSAAKPDLPQPPPPTAKPISPEPAPIPPAPVISPLGVRPPAEKIEIEKLETRKTESAGPPIQPRAEAKPPPEVKAPPPASPTPPSPHVITKEELQKQIERFRSPTTPQPQKAPPAIALKPEPPPPERYTTDPYKEPIE